MTGGVLPAAVVQFALQQKAIIAICNHPPFKNPLKMLFYKGFAL